MGNMSMDSNRLQFIDIIKGIAIIFVVLAHLIQTNTLESKTNVVFQIINSFHMPLFFFASGFIVFKVCKLEKWQKYKSFFVSKLRSLVLPCIVWNLVVDKFFFLPSWNMINTNDLHMLFRGGAYWFLMTLSWLSLIFGVLHLISNKVKKIYIDAILFLIVLGGLVLLREMSLGLYFIFYSIGVFVSKYAFLGRIWNHSITFFVAFFIFVILVAHWKIEGSFVDDVLKVVIAPCAFIIITSLSKKNENVLAGRMLSYIGRYSLVIYLVHWKFLMFFNNYKFHSENFNQFWLFLGALFISMVVVYASIGIGKIIESNEYLAFIMLGHKLKK